MHPVVALIFMMTAAVYGSDYSLDHCTDQTALPFIDAMVSGRNRYDISSELAPYLADVQCVAPQLLHQAASTAKTNRQASSRRAANSRYVQKSKKERRPKLVMINTGVDDYYLNEKGTVCMVPLEPTAPYETVIDFDKGIALVNGHGVRCHR